MVLGSKRGLMTTREVLILFLEQKCSLGKVGRVSSLWVIIFFEEYELFEKKPSKKLILIFLAFSVRMGLTLPLVTLKTHTLN